MNLISERASLHLLTLLYQDDFYLNLVDWGANDCLAVGLGTCVYLWNANTSNVTKLCDLVNDSITSVGWAQYGSHLAIGTNKGHVLLYDTEVSRRVRTWTGHTGRSGKCVNFPIIV